MNGTLLFPMVFWIIFILVLVLIGWWGIKRSRPRARPYVQTGGGGQMELDIRLPYKRFRELYPYSKISYKEYKQLQMQKAFRKAVSSQENKRMVR